MSKNTALTTLLAYLLFLSVWFWFCNPCAWYIAPNRTALVELEIYWRRVVLTIRSTTEEKYWAQWEHVTKDSSLSVWGAFLWGSDRFPLGEIGGGDKHGRILWGTEQFNSNYVT